VRYATTFAAGFLLAAPAFGHHSDAGLDMGSVVTVEGTVTEFSWRNPHVYINVETTDQGGEATEWTLQLGSTITVMRMGWDRDSLSPGDRVTVRAHAAIDGRPYGLLNFIEKEGGVVLPTSFDRGSAEPVLTIEGAAASTSTLEGRWMADVSKLISYPGGFDGFFRAELTLTDEARAAQAAFDELSYENPESTCIGRPTPGMIIATNLYPIEIEINEDEETVLLRSEYYDDERTVYMDGRAHPVGGERTIGGHSIGRWDGDVLVVDTANFADHRSPYQIGVPSGAQKHVVERYQLTEEGTRILLEFMLEDPEYLTEPMTHSRELIYSPQMQMSQFNCDPEVTRRFVPQ